MAAFLRANRIVHSQSPIELRIWYRFVWERVRTALRAFVTVLTECDQKNPLTNTHDFSHKSRRHNTLTTLSLRIFCHFVYTKEFTSCPPRAPKEQVFLSSCQRRQWLPSYLHKRWLPQGPLRRSPSPLMCTTRCWQPESKFCRGDNGRYFFWQQRRRHTVCVPQWMSWFGVGPFLILDLP